MIPQGPKRILNLPPPGLNDLVSKEEVERKIRIPRQINEFWAHSVDIRMEADLGPRARMTIVVDGDHAKILELAKLIAEGKDVLRHALHLDTVQCSTCIMDKMGEDQNPNPNMAQRAP